MTVTLRHLPGRPMATGLAFILLLVTLSTETVAFVEIGPLLTYTPRVLGKPSSLGHHAGRQRNVQYDFILPGRSSGGELSNSPPGNAQRAGLLQGSSLLTQNRRLLGNAALTSSRAKLHISHKQGGSTQQSSTANSGLQQLQRLGKPAPDKTRSARSPAQSLTGARGVQLGRIGHQPMQQHRRLAAETSNAGSNNSCWEGFPGFPASSGHDLRRLLEDPAANRIDLQGDIFFDEVNFPPPPPGSPCTALNVTHRVSCQAAVGRAKPLSSCNHP